MSEQVPSNEIVRRIKRTCEMSAGIMRDRERTGGWEGAEKVARQFDRLAELASQLESTAPEPPAEHEWPLITRIKADIVANCFENREWSAESEDHCATLDLLSEALEVIKERAAQPPRVPRGPTSVYLDHLNNRASPMDGCDCTACDDRRAALTKESAP